MKLKRNLRKRGKENRATEDARFTLSGTKLAPHYSAERGSAKRVNEVPGKFPFTRGIHPSMYRGKLWTMRQYAGFGTAEEANSRFRFLLARGTTGLSIAFDLPTQMGRDCDHQLSKGEVGRVGVSISSVEEAHLLLREIPLDQVSISMTINATASILLAFVLVVAEERGVAWDKLNGTVQNDILKEYIARGTYIFPPDPALRLITDLCEFCGAQVPNWNTISVSGYHIREAGSTAIDEVAFTLANAITYLEAARARGLKVDDVAPRIAFFFNCHIDFFEEVAKFRAARRLWAKIMKHRFRAKNPRSMMLRFHTQTAGSSLTAQQPLNNVVRTAIEAMAAVMGGTQSLHTNSFDEALGLPTEESAELALRTQQIIAYESGIAEIADPLGGSYLVESLTDSIEVEAEKKITRIEKLGGMVRAIEAGVPQHDIESSAYDFQKRIERQERIIVGVNRFSDNAEQVKEALVLNSQTEREACLRVASLRQQREKTKVDEALSQLERAAGQSTNLMPYIIQAARVRATLGEIADRLRVVFGEFRP